jgi:hypothetical protein
MKKEFNVVELASELAYRRLIHQWENVDLRSDNIFNEDNEGYTSYTPDAQEMFDEFYDIYYDIINK